MAAEHHKFRYLLKPGTDFQFSQKFRLWLTISGILTVISIGSLFVNKAVHGSYMNWTIDFKGGTEIVYSFKKKVPPPAPGAKAAKPIYVAADTGKVRETLQKAGAEGFEVSDMSWTDEETDDTVKGVMVRTPRFGATTEKQQKEASELFEKAFADRNITTAPRWSGDRVFVRTTKPIGEKEAAEVFAKAGLETKPWGEATHLYTTPDEGTGEYQITFAMNGLDRQYEVALEKALPDIDVQMVQTSQVSAKAGKELRNDGIKSLFYAMLLIVLYLAVRFDVRYAPGAILATVHDAVMVIGTFSVTYTEVSLTSVAALLTVIGFSVNDTVVIFDRIRENQVKLKDKKLDRIVDISLNEVVVRSLLTSSTLFAVTLMMNVFGTGLVRNFAFAMNAGIITGAYSSIFLAPPAFLWVSKKYYSGPPAARARAAQAIAAEP